MRDHEKLQKWHAQKLQQALEEHIPYGEGDEGPFGMNREGIQPAVVKREPQGHFYDLEFCMWLQANFDKLVREQLRKAKAKGAGA